LLIHGGIRLGGRILDQFEGLVAEDDLARRRGNVAADLEGRHVGLLDAEPPVRRLHVFLQMLQALDQVGAVAGERGAQHFRVGDGEVGGRHRVGDLLHIEAGLAPRVLVNALGVLDEILRPVGGDQVELLEEVEDRVFLPVLVLEALVAAGGLRHRLHRLAESLGQGVLPQLAIAVPQLLLRLHQLLRFVHVGLRHGPQRLGDLLHGGELGFGFRQHRVWPLRHMPGDGGGLLEDLRHVLRELDGIGERVLRRGRRLLLCHDLHLKGECDSSVVRSFQNANR